MGFVSEDGPGVLADSTDILRWADARLPEAHRLYPAGELGGQAAALESELDDGLGPDGRLWIYHETLPVVDRLRPGAEAGLPLWERLAFRISGPLVGAGVSHVLGVNDTSAAAALTSVDATFDAIARRMSDGRRFMLGEAFSPPPTSRSRRSPLRCCCPTDTGRRCPRPRPCRGGRGPARQAAALPSGRLGSPTASTTRSAGRGATAPSAPFLKSLAL